MLRFYIIIISCLFFIGCGIKDDPEYQSQYKYNKTVYII